MKKYYLHNGSENIGPFDIEELKDRKITRTTQVWYEGMSDWKNANEVEELNALFASMPPPIKKEVVPPLQEKKAEKPKTHWLLSALRKTAILIFIIIGISASVSYYDDQKNASTPTDFMEKVMSTAELEATYPKNYLDASGTYNTNLLGSKLKITGYIDNKATITAYKNVTIDVIFYDSSKNELNRESFTLNDFIPANSRKEFKHKVNNYSNVKSIGWEVSNAVPNR